MPRILIDVTRLMYRRLTGTLPTGIDRVSLEYIHHYSVNARAVLSLGPFSAVLSAADSVALFRAVTGEATPIRGLAARLILKSVLWRWLCVRFPRAFLFNTGHIGLENRHYAWGLRFFGVRPMVVVHDLIPITHPQYCRPGEPEKHIIRMDCAVKIGAGIVANSEHTLQVLREFCRDRQRRLPPSVVAPLAPGLPAIVPGPRPLAEPYFVVLGTIEPRKNHWMLLQLWRRLADTMGESAPRLVLIGQRGWMCDNVIDLLARSSALKRVVVELPRCSDTELITWLHHAQALLFASFAEGYGLPVAEALSLGVPVIASEVPVFREIAGDVPEYADARDEPHWEQLVRAYAANDSGMRAAQLARMQQFRLTTWAQHFEKVDGLLAALDREAERQS